MQHRATFYLGSRCWIRDRLHAVGHGNPAWPQECMDLQQGTFVALPAHQNSSISVHVAVARSLIPFLVWPLKASSTAVPCFVMVKGSLLSREIRIS